MYLNTQIYFFQFLAISTFDVNIGKKKQRWKPYLIVQNYLFFHEWDYDIEFKTGYENIKEGIPNCFKSFKNDELLSFYLLSLRT